MSAPPLLVELLTEELPPKTLRLLAADFGKELTKLLRQDGFLSANSSYEFFATPRRLALRINDVLPEAPSREVLLKGPAIASGLDANGKPTPALLGFSKKCGAPVEKLERMHDGKQEVFAYRSITKSERLHAHLELKIQMALDSLPIAKLMSYQLANGTTTVKFARPAHRLVVLHGTDVISVTALGLTADRITEGHRFQSKVGREITLDHAGEYENKLQTEGSVIADFDIRRADIDRQLSMQATKLGAQLGDEKDVATLLDEVTALVEWPAVYVGEFGKEFLEVPQECLVLTMRANQKYFPLFDEQAKLINKFLIVSNMRLADPHNIIEGNQRVIRPRLADARFFFETDKKTKLADRVPQLANIVYHNKLGSQLDRVERVRKLAVTIAGLMGADTQLADRAALLAKADLVTHMVNEFPELQGTMGRYYALADGESAKVAEAIEQHYRPRFAGDTLPEEPTACAVALADKLDALAGLFNIGQQPTGDKDPFGLRRAALGVIRILVEKQLSASLLKLVDAAFESFPNKTQTDLQIFFIERMRSYFLERGYTANEVEAVLSKNPVGISSIPQQLEAVRAFAALPEALDLAAANKRIANIMRQAESKGESLLGGADISVLKDPAEIALYQALHAAIQSAKPLFDARDFNGYLKTFASLKSPVNSFFENVMVMVDDKKLRENRLALLFDMQNAMNRFADISKLAA